MSSLPDDMIEGYGPGTGETRAQRLNRGCSCVTLNGKRLSETLDEQLGIPGFARSLQLSHPTLFSGSPVFVPFATLGEMTAVVAAIEAATHLTGFRNAALKWAPPSAIPDHGPAGALMGFDFHLGPEGPKLIEVNTNAGGAFLNDSLARAQDACCQPRGSRPPERGSFGERIAEMFLCEWRRQRGSGRPRLTAIIDDDPQTQYLFPEFRLARSLLRSNGIECIIGDARDLSLVGSTLTLSGEPVDLIYNRLVDFGLEDPVHAALRAAYDDGQVVLTPNPHVYALFADKRNLTLLSDTGSLRAWGLAQVHSDILAAAVPPTVRVNANNADSLWTGRKNWFFKPARGHASKAAYRGDKLTKRVWGDILASEYIAQTYAAPSAREIEFDGLPVALKVDLRLYTYSGAVLLAAARLYQGQTTNMRTPGGGFAPVLVVP